MGLHCAGLIFVDIETSGLDYQKNEIIQIAAVHAPTKDEFECKVRFDMARADKTALDMNHYTKEAWAEALTQEQMLKEFSDYCKKHQSIEKMSKRGTLWYTAALAGYNIASFDSKFIKNAYIKHDMFIPFDYRVYDVYELAKWMYPGRNSYKLSDMARYLGVYDENAHDALADAKMTMAVAIEMMRQLAVAGVPIPSWAKIPEQKQEVGNDKRRDED